jgi:hypothetical protein
MVIVGMIIWMKLHNEKLMKLEQLWLMNEVLIDMQQGRSLILIAMLCY